MANARQMRDWDMASSMLAMMHNVNCTKRSDMKSPAHYHPLRAAAKSGIRITVDNINMLKTLTRKSRR